MSLQNNIMTAIKTAMKSKDTVALTALRSVKSAILLAQTESGSKDSMSEAEEVKLLQKLVKQRQDSAAIFSQQNRPDLAAPELAEAEIISQFLPEMLSEAEVEKHVVVAIEKLGATSMKDMGKVMGVVSKELAGKTDGKTISTLVKQKLMS
ncbi:MAG: GatB/YqeY domain-containing protein [Bacteroidetes bacterium]|nr:GatB/YqeY domain-containing protein [Bacteroidota bacterium]MDA0859976.1 GatB/YqeY domain-containing protein [Bacteroidota bacterium]MDA1319162.1 GatB/YqeY domain-containing protein [Bacteroidota bacterium]